MAANESRMQDGWLRITRDIRIGFRAGKAIAEGHEPAIVEAAVFKWQAENRSHPKYEFAEQWLQTFEPPKRVRYSREEQEVIDNFLKYFSKLSKRIPTEKAEKIMAQIELGLVAARPKR
jgi:hypothetical protein